MRIFRIIGFSEKNKEDKKESGMNIEHILATIAIVGSILSFLFMNRDAISQYFSTTKISISTKSKFHYTYAKVQLISKDINITIPLKEISKGIEVIEGNYNINILLYNQRIWAEENIYIKKDTETIIPVKLNHKIIVDTYMFPAIPTRGEAFDLQINSSGTGCLWIYDIANNDYNKIYPRDTSCLNIVAGEKFYLDKKINASKKKQEDFLVLLITASHNYSDAQSIMQMYSKKRALKASFNESKLNWGIKELKYKIK